MSSNNSFSGFDWGSFEKSFGSHFPKGFNNQSAASIEQFVQQVLKQSIPAMDDYMKAGPYDTEITEAERSLMVKINLPGLREAKNRKVSVSTIHIRVGDEGDSKESLQLVRLPHPVVPESCRAVYKDGVLHLEIQKQTKEETFVGVDIRYMD